MAFALELRRPGGKLGAVAPFAPQQRARLSTVVQWQRYQRARRGPTLLRAHEEYLRERAKEVGYSAQFLYQELRARGYRGSYETVKLFARPLRTRASSAEETLKRLLRAEGTTA
ncbi:MAG: hypothetical protein ACR2M4_14245 [Actinomycetota bacterium]